MLPNKMDVLRKSYGPEFIELMNMVSAKLMDVTIPEDTPYQWELIIPVDRVLTPLEGFKLRQELNEAGWGFVQRLKTLTSEELVIYIPVRT
jgi:hypothetical protein